MSRLMLSGPVIRARPRPPMRLILVAVILIVAAYALYAYQHNHNKPESSAPSAQATLPVSGIVAVGQDEELEDVLLHADHVRQNLMHVQESLNRAQARIRQVRPALSLNFMTMQNQRLDVAERACESGLQDTARAIEEIEILQSKIQQRRK